MQCIVSLCEGVAQLGADTEIVSYAINMHPDEPEHPPFEELYGIKTNLRHTTYKLFNINRSKWGFLLEPQRLFVYTLYMLRFIVRVDAKPYKNIILSARNYSILAMLALVKRIWKKKFIVLADVHVMPRTVFESWVHKIVDGNVCISKSLANALREKTGLPLDKLSVAHSGVKIERFTSKNVSKRNLQIQLNLPINKNIVCYTGKVYYRYKEIDYYLQVSEKLNNGTVMVIIGGRPDHVSKWRKECYKRNISNVVFRSFIPPSKIPDYLIAADLLVMYYPPLPQIDYTSPSKLFEYLASGVPVISCRSKSIEEVIKDGENGFLVDRYQPHLLAEKINEILASRERMEFVGKNGKKLAEEFSWQRRAKAFLECGLRVSNR